MTDEHGAAGLGGYFSRNYLLTPTSNSDDQRARYRLATFLKNYFDDRGTDVGQFISAELGIPCVTRGSYASYVDWEKILLKVPINDLLDIVTAISKHSPQRTKIDGRKRENLDFIAFCARVFDEQRLQYRIDEQGGVHPLVDTHFSVSTITLIKGLSDARLAAARHHIETAEKCLLESSFDGRGALRAVFDAAENLLKQINPKSTQLNKDAVLTVLKPALLAAQGSSEAEQRAAIKLIESLTDWVEAAHFYRHEPGAPEPDQPSHSFVVSFVSQGMAFVRWIADAYLKRRTQP